MTVTKSALIYKDLLKRRAYDERSRFVRYCAALPVSRALAVSEKYIMGLFVQIAVLFITGTAQYIKAAKDGVFLPAQFTVMMLSLLIVSMLASSIPLPFIFKSGVEKGRIAYYIMIGIVCGAGVLFSEIFGGGADISAPSKFFLIAAAILGVCVYALSWYLSVVFYKKREL